MAVKNKTVEVQIQEARREGFENALVVKDSGNSYSNGLAITKALYQLREQLAQEIEANYMGAVFNKYEEGFDDGMKMAVTIVRGK